MGNNILENTIVKILCAINLIVFLPYTLKGERYNSSSGINYVYTPYGGVADVESGANWTAGSNVSGSVSVLKSFTIKNSEYTVKSIGHWAFLYNYSLRSITIPETVETINYDAFYGCTNLTSVNMVDGLISIGERSFYNCSNLIHVPLPSTVTKIGAYAFSGCSNIVSIAIPDGVNSIAEYTFSGCSSLSQVMMNSVKSLGNYCFRNNTVLRNVSLPDCLTNIGSGVFENCGLECIVIPNSVITIGEYAFSKCYNLQHVVSSIEEPFAIKSNVFYADKNDSKFTTAILYVPNGTLNKYQKTEGWKEFTNIIEIGGNTISSLSESQNINFKTSIPQQLELKNMVIGNTYYNLNHNNGDVYNINESCIELKSETSDESITEITSCQISDPKLSTLFNGIMFMVPAGSGTVKVTAETIGSKYLMVKIVDNEAKSFYLAEKETIEIPYSVTEPTYVYIYADSAKLTSKSNSITTDEECVKIYGYEWIPDNPTGVCSLYNNITKDNNTSFSIDGKRLSQPQKGLNIIRMSDGTTRKVVK